MEAVKSTPPEWNNRFRQDILDGTVPLPSGPPKTFIEESYLRLYKPDAGGQPGWDQYAYIHPGGVCVVGICPNHAVLAAAAADTSETGSERIVDQRAKGGGDASPSASLQVDFGQRRGVSRADVKSSGKTKNRNAVLLQAESVLCTIRVAGQVFKVRAGLPGKLLEVNSRLTSSPELLLRSPTCEGHIALMALSEKDTAQAKATMMPPAEFCQHRGIDIDRLR